MTFGSGERRAEESRGKPRDLLAERATPRVVSPGVTPPRTKPADETALPAAVLALPAQPAVRVLDLLRAIDAAIVAGDLHPARALVAEAMGAVAVLDAGGVRRTRCP